MKKILFLIPIALFLLSCGKTIDKKIDLTEYQKTIEVIKEKHPEYSQEDFSKASKLVDKLAFKAMTSGSTKTDKTYRELLDEAKAENEKEAAEVKAYYDELDKLRAIVSVDVLESEYLEEDYGSYQPYRSFSSEMEFKNLSDKDITGIDGKMLVKNPAGELIKTAYIKLADSDLLPAGASQRNAKKYPVLDSYDNIMELKANAPENFQYEWMPELIIFKDGSRMEAPKKPYALLAD